ncbi:MAG: 30S ribosomal protein S9 [Proteobacteria bacterium]|nr:30S ribosomal protein S9 [Pseudomonadota bacterium]
MVEKKIYATGRRKRAISRVWIKPGTGKIIVNGISAEKYFKLPTAMKIVKDPLVVTNTLNSVDVQATLIGGGMSGQAGALRHGIARALVNFNSEYREALKKAGFLTRDPREVERKKYGKPKARKRFQYSKR